MNKTDRVFIEARLQTEDAQKVLKILKVGPNIEEIIKALEPWPPFDKVIMAHVLAGTQRWKLLCSK